MAFVIVVSLIATVLAPAPTENDSPARITYEPHDPIYIDGNANFSDTATWQNWSGNGTLGNPYLIQGYDINASSTIGIYIGNTNVYFIITNCSIHDGESFNFGIFLDWCTNGTVTGNIFSNNYDGVRLEFSCGNTISNNIFINDDQLDKVGVEIFWRSDNNIFNNNTCSDCDIGIWSWSSSNGTISNNNCSSNVLYGIYLEESSNNSLNNNTCSSNGEEGIFLELSNSNTLSNNTCSNNTYDGIWLLYSNSTALRNNNCSNKQYYGICIDHSINNTISKNTCNSNVYSGIHISRCLASMITGNTLANNNCSSNGLYGIYSWSSSNGTISNNNCSSNSEEGIYLELTIDNIIWNNTFYHNNGAGDSYNATNIQGYDAGGKNNRWNSSDGYGNWWSDWRSPDMDMNGIVDMPYNISGDVGANDSYPRTNPLWIPEFSGVIIPIAGLMLIALVLGRTRKKKGKGFCAFVPIPLD